MMYVQRYNICNDVRPSSMQCLLVSRLELDVRDDLCMAKVCLLMKNVD